MHEICAIAVDEETVGLVFAQFLAIEVKVIVLILLYNLPARRDPFLREGLPVGPPHLLGEPFERHVGPQHRHRPPRAVVNGKEA